MRLVLSPVFGVLASLAEQDKVRGGVGAAITAMDQVVDADLPTAPTPFATPIVPCVHFPLDVRRNHRRDRGKKDANPQPRQGVRDPTLHPRRPAS